MGYWAYSATLAVVTVLSLLLCLSLWAAGPYEQRTYAQHSPHEHRLHSTALFAQRKACHEPPSLPGTATSTASERAYPSQIRQLRADLSPAHFSLAQRHLVDLWLCLASRGIHSCDSRRVQTDALFPSNASSPPLQPRRSILQHELNPVDSPLGRMVAAVLPTSLPHLDLLVLFGLTFVRHNPRADELFDVIWIVVPDSQVDAVFERLLAEGALHACMRVVGESVLVPELLEARKPYRGWLRQQAIKLLVAAAVRTDYYIALDADTMAGRELSITDLINVTDGRARTTAERADRFYAYVSGTLNRTCITIQLPCNNITGSTVMMAYTPIMLHTHIVYSLATYLERREQRPWMEYLIDVNTGPDIKGVNLRRLKDPHSYIKPLWTEYCLYWLFALSIGVYDVFHSAVVTRHFNSRVSEHEDTISAYFSLPPHTRTPFLNIDDNKPSLNLSLLRQRLLDAMGESEPFAQQTDQADSNTGVQGAPPSSLLQPSSSSAFSPQWSQQRTETMRGTFEMTH